MHDIAPGAQATLDQLGQAVLDAIYVEHQNKNPQAETIIKRWQKKEISEEQYVSEIEALFAGDSKGMVEFMLNGLRDSSTRKAAVDKYLLARSMVDVSTTT
ncbi:hypothetical protein SEA_MAGRITTE_215 [Microbacterium phage Magritte]|nr:hypothetical protein SEA_MAGRITTE_215 [Microbacterium phage Magritte]